MNVIFESTKKLTANLQTHYNHLATLEATLVYNFHNHSSRFRNGTHGPWYVLSNKKYFVLRPFL